MISLKNVTLVTVDGVDPNLSARVLNYCCRGINFGDIKLLSFQQPEHHISEYINFIKIAKLTMDGYNRFIAKDLYSFIDTDFCLIVQLDGFILHSELWTDEFLKYDYVGAPWSDINIDSMMVNKYKKKPVGQPWIGNGGFSLRSRRILEEASKFEWPGGTEDTFFCVELYDHMIKKGITYCPIDLGYKFSLESVFPCGRTTPIFPKWPDDFSTHFGFHGYKNIIGDLSI